jgi:hypothetical protein
MPDFISTHISLARTGLAKILNARETKATRFFDRMGFKIINTREAYVRITSQNALGYLQVVGEGDAHPEAAFETPHTRDYSWAIYSLKYSQSKEKALADQYAKLTTGALSRMLTLAANQTDESLAANVFNNAFTSAGSFAGLDGAALCSYAHPLAVGTSSNRGNGSADSDLSATELGNAIQELMRQRQHKGEPYMCPGPYRLIVSPSNRVQAETLRQSVLLPGTGNNDRNIAGGDLEMVVVNPYLTDGDAWFLVDSRRAEGLHKLQFGPRAAVEVWDDPDRRLVHYGITMRLAYGHHDWRGVWGSAGA